MEEDFAQWYTDIVKKADLIEYSSVKGCMLIRPYGYAVWENIQRILEKNGIACIQSHPYFYGMAESSEIMVEEHEFAIRQAIIASAKLGVKRQT